MISIHFIILFERFAELGLKLLLLNGKKKRKRFALKNIYLVVNNNEIFTKFYANVTNNTDKQVINFQRILCTT